MTCVSNHYANDKHRSFFLVRRNGREACAAPLPLPRGPESRSGHNLLHNEPRVHRFRAVAGSREFRYFGYVSRSWIASSTSLRATSPMSVLRH